MNRFRFLSILALALSLGLSACGTPGASTDGTQAQEQQAREQFLNERGGNAGTGAGNTGGSENVPVAASVERVEGQTIILKSMETDGKTLTVQVGNDTKVLQETPIKTSDIKAGDPITAFGAKEGDGIKADIVQIGDLLDAEGISVQSGQVAGPAGSVEASGGASGGAAPAAGGSQAGTELPKVSGTVESVKDNAIVVKQTDGKSVTVTSTDMTGILKQVEVKLADLKPGTMVLVTGPRNGETIQATQVRLMPGPSLATP